ncbi:FERM domain-containing protein 6 [Portunus trituberculatus]|uniref:FERM domain-containing protein 6 n=1 Tax=Portunus trituberculatus TaxID=210409 RepID=A0A5B7GEL4_PORTR|nr:FERM domain-containing protein 6 [Portunus trituberculatus]
MHAINTKAGDIDAEVDNDRWQGMDASDEPLLQFKFRVQFYVETHLLLRDGLSRLHYYLQLRENVLQYQQPLSDEAAFLLASHALQADLGDYSEDQHHGHYFDPALYFPSWVVERVGVAYLMEHTAHLHRDIMGQTRAEAQAHYIREASQQEAPHNLHLYRLRYKKQDPTPTVVTAICARGLDIYEEDPGAPLHASRKLLSTFQWSTIGKLTFEVSIVASARKLWNSLPASVFPSSYDLNSFNRGGRGGFKTFIPFFWLTLAPARGLAIESFFFNCFVVLVQFSSLT